MKRIFLLILAAVFCALCLTACDPYTSHYKAVAFVHSNDSDSASMSFSEFEGTMVFKLTRQNSDQKITYSGSVAKGNISVTYDHDGSRKKLVSVREGEPVRGSAAELTNDTVYVIVESDGKCENGSLTFAIE